MSWELYEGTPAGRENELLGEIEKLKRKSTAYELQLIDILEYADELLSWKGALCNSAKVGHTLKSLITLGNEELKK